MTLSGFSLVLTAAFCHAVWNYLVKRINGGPELVWLFSTLSAIVYLPLAAYVFLLTPAFEPWQLVFIAGSAALHLGYFLLLQRGYRHGDLSLVYPTARATGPLLSTTLAVLILGETLSPQMAIGAVAIVVGVVFLTGGFGRRGRHAGASVLFGMATGLLIGSYTVWDAYAVSTLMISPLLLDYASSIGRSLLLAPVAARRRARVVEHWRAYRWAIIGIAIFNPLAYILVLYALSFTPVVYVAPIRETSVLITVMMGSLLLGEGDVVRRLAWATLILAGVAVLATA